MPTSKNRFARVLLLGLAASCFAPLGASVPATAFDGTDASPAEKTPLPIFKNPRAALQAGLEGFQSGDAHWLDAMRYAAAGGMSLARWKLGRMYADGEGVPRDDIKAYEYFSEIVDSYDEDNFDRREAGIVASAYVAVGVYTLNGIANSRVRPDPGRAMEMFEYAATNFGDPNAQYNLARMYLDGNGVGRSGLQAARWLDLAAKKGHAQAQALLGHMLFSGHEGVPRQRATGLMWLTLARNTAQKAGKSDQWILDLYDKDSAAASETDRQLAEHFVADRGN